MNQLFAALWKPTDLGFVTFWLRDSSSKRSYHLPVADVLTAEDSALAELIELADGASIYYAHGLRGADLGLYRQGKKTDVVLVSAFVLDVDFHNDIAHKAQNLPADLDAAEPLLVRADGTPQVPPSAVVLSGNGAHLYWFLAEPFVFDTSGPSRAVVENYSRAFQAPMITKAADLGWVLDSTHTLQRVWRVPGTTNPKNGRPVELVYVDPTVRYRIEDFGLDPAITTKVRTGTPSPRLVTDADLPTGPILEPPAGLEAIWNELVAYRGKHQVAVQALIRGQSLAPAGARENTLRDVGGVVAFLDRGQHPPAELAQLFVPSLSVWAAEPGATKTLEDELEKTETRICSSQDYYKSERAKEARAFAALTRWSTRRLDTNPAVDPDEDDDVTEDINPAACKKRLVLIHGRGTYPLDLRSSPPEYTSWVVLKENLSVFLRDAWENAPAEAELDLQYVNSRSEIKDKQIPKLLIEYGTVIKAVVSDLSLTRSYYEPDSNTFYNAAAIPRVTDAEFDPRIDTWLKAMAGDQYDRLCDWLACVYRIDAPLAALYLGGAAGAGKGLLARGIARRWHTGAPVVFEQAAGAFNAALAECPLLWIDEAVTNSKARDLSSQVRAIVGSATHEIRDKHINGVRSLRGYLRLMICANNDSVLSFRGESLGVEDQRAIAERILYIPVLEGGREWLRANNDAGAITTEWVEQDGIARHCLYLMKNRQVVPGRRFLVEGCESSMHRKLTAAGDFEGLVMEWVVRFATHPGDVYAKIKEKNGDGMLAASIGSGRILVNSQGLIDCWKMYGLAESFKRPHANVIGRILKKFSEGTVNGRKGDNRRKYHCIKPSLVLEWAEANQMGSPERIKVNLQGESAVELDNVIPFPGGRI